MYVTDLEEVMDIMLDAIKDEESVNYVAEADKIRELMQLVCFNTDYIPDIIEFDTENEGYYYFSFDKDCEDNITFSVYGATDEDGDFIGMRGVLLVDEDVPKNFEKEVSYDILLHPIRVNFEKECSGDCANCEHSTNPDPVLIKDEDGTVRGFHKEWKGKEYGVDASYAFTFRCSDEDTVYNMMKNFN